jgi:hypothetical protein
MLRRTEINSLLKLGFSLGLNKIYKNLEDYNNMLTEKITRGVYYFPCLEGTS